MDDALKDRLKNDPHHTGTNAEVRAAGIAREETSGIAQEAPTSGEVKRPRLSPLNRRRWQNFKANRRGYWSFWVFGVLLLICLFAEFIANDRPLLIRYDELGE